MRVLVACEFSGVVRDAFIARGHAAYSCDTLPGEGHNVRRHIQDDIRNVLSPRPGHLYEVRPGILIPPSGWDLLIAFPPCTYLCSSGLHWNTRVPGRAAKTEEALDFVRFLLDQPIHMIALENPVGCIGSRIRKADQYIQPYQFGHDASKNTGLWLKNLPPLNQTDYVPPRLVDGKPRWGNQTDSGQNRLGPSETRAMERGRTYPGIGAAMAAQWGRLSAF